jgi:hypothetical protein
VLVIACIKKKKKALTAAAQFEVDVNVLNYSSTLNCNVIKANFKVYIQGKGRKCYTLRLPL